MTAAKGATKDKAPAPEPHEIKVTVTAPAQKMLTELNGSEVAQSAQRFIEKIAGGRVSRLEERSTVIPFSTTVKAGESRLAKRGDAGIFFTVVGTPKKPEVRVFGVVTLVNSTPTGTPHS